MLKGSIIKLSTVDLFNDRTSRRNKAEWVYGVLNAVEEECEEPEEKAWSIIWATDHLVISNPSLSHIATWLETDLHIVRSPHEDHIKLDKYYTTNDLFIKNDGKWEVKDIRPFCEYCHAEDCDRMKFWHV